MGKYTHLETEFTQGYINGKWGTLSQFAISKGIKPNNGAFKKDSTGWTKKAKRIIDEDPEEIQKEAKEKYREQALKDWEVVYSNLGEAAITMAKKIKEITDDNDFIYTDRQESQRVDIAAIKGLMDAGVQALSLHRKTYTFDNIPLPTESMHKVEEAKQIKKEEKGGDDDNLIEDRIKAKMKAHGFDQ